MAATVAGHGLVREAQAIPSPDLQNMSSPTGGTVTITFDSYYTWVELTNTAGVPLKIIAIRPNEFTTRAQPPDEVPEPECVANLVVPPGSKCKVAFQGPPV